MWGGEDIGKLCNFFLFTTVQDLKFGDISNFNLCLLVLYLLYLIALLHWELGLLLLKVDVNVVPVHYKEWAMYSAVTPPSIMMNFPKNLHFSQNDTSSSFPNTWDLTYSLILWQFWTENHRVTCAGHWEQCDDQQYGGQEEEDSEHLPALLPWGRLGRRPPPSRGVGPGHHPRPPPLLRCPPRQGCQKVPSVHPGVRSETEQTESLDGKIPQILLRRVKTANSKQQNFNLCVSLEWKINSSSASFDKSAWIGLARISDELKNRKNDIDSLI